MSRSDAIDSAVGSGLRLRRYPAWLPPTEADLWFTRLLAEVTWKQEYITLFGRRHALPRLSCWMADPGCDYRYSDLQNVIEPWCAAAAELRRRVSVQLGCPFNSLLLNLYRDGQDSMGWHADDEPELDSEAPIASLSLGAVRTLRLRSLAREGPPPIALELGHGELLAMDPPTQLHWQHALPRRLRVRSPRLNLTFRVVRRRA